VRGATMDVEAPAAPRWRKRMQPITHARQRRSYFQPLLLGSPRRRKRSPPPSAAGFGRLAIARGAADRRLDGVLSPLLTQARSWRSCWSF
jgi:hypothetical protein